MYPFNHEWRKEAACLDLCSDTFYPEEAGRLQAATDVCESCMVRPECLLYALNAGEPYGVWGGLSIKARTILLTKIAARGLSNEVALSKLFTPAPVSRND